ncbi:MAG: (d)CMP kinase [Candidatus Stahlbacteria bacterium]|nr:(d)CMP kinase [Candidatus Stahlbacteria bacterium]
MIVTIDGPAGSGKSTTARLVAQKLGFKYLDTGATYRAVALAVIRNNIDPKERHAVEHLASELTIDFEEGKVILDGEDITQEIRTEEVGRVASLCATYKGVRENMVTLQRRLARSYDVVCEGRDIGTVVFPEAEVKIYLDASLSERAKRRANELVVAKFRFRRDKLQSRLGGTEKGMYSTIEKIEKDLLSRDLQDSQREYSPLRIPEDAVIIDTTNLSIDEEVEAVIKVISNIKNQTSK